MKPGAPWSIKGIDPEAREAAKNAAAQVGMTLGEFFNHILLETDPTEIVRGGQASSASPSNRMSAPAIEPDIMGSTQAAGDMAELRQSVSLVSEQIVSLQEQGQQTPELSQKALEDINYRIEESRQQSENSIAETQNTLAGISERFEASIARSNEAMTTVGKAIEVMAGRIESLEKRPGIAAMQAPAASDPAIPDEIPEESLEESQSTSLAGALDDYSPAESDDWVEKIAGNDDSADQADVQHQAEDTDESDNVTSPDASAENSSADDSLSDFDVDTYLAEKAEQIDSGFSSEKELDSGALDTDMPESAVSETADLEVDDQETDDADTDDLKTGVSALTPPSNASVDDFLNQFGEDMLVSPQSDDQQEASSETAPPPSDDAEDNAAPDDAADGSLIEPEYESEEPVQSPGKSPQDVIEAIRRAARHSSMPEAYDENGELISGEDRLDEDERVSTERGGSHQSDRSSGVKYAIYAACTAVLLAAGGWIASMKGLI